MPTKLTLLLSAIALLLPLAAASPADSEALKSMTVGQVALKSIGALEVGPDGVLFVGDSQGSAVYALGMTPPASGKTGSLKMIEDLDEKIAALLGTTARGVHTKDMAVDEASGTVYLSVMRGSGDDARPVLLRVLADGKIEDVRLDSVPHSKLNIANAPAEDAKLYSWNSRTFTITDLEYIDGELYIAGLSNEEFASNLRRIPYPFKGEPEVTSLEIYHGAHGAYETFAPIFSFVPYEIEGKQYLLAGYLCTPLVTFPLDKVRTEKKLRGKTIAELGWGNIPSDMVPYEKDGEGYLLMINSSRGNMRFKKADIVAAQQGAGITSSAGPRTGVEDETVSIGNVVQAANYNKDSIAVLGRSMENGALYLRIASKRRL